MHALNDFRTSVKRFMHLTILLHFKSSLLGSPSLCLSLSICLPSQVLDIAETGDAGEVDMLVRDIYGGDCESSKDLVMIMN
jgi:hypothetical protein